MILLCVIFIACMLILYFIKKSKVKGAEGTVREECKKVQTGMQCLSKPAINIILLILLSVVLLLLFMMSPVQWAAPKQFNENTIDLIRVFSLLGFCVNAVLIWQNRKNKKFICIVMAANIYMVYKVTRTFIIQI